MQQIYTPYHNYQKQKDNEVFAASPVKLIGMLLEGAILFNKKAIMAFEENRKVNALEMVDRACKIVQHLYDCLDLDQPGDVPAKLASLYDYILNSYMKFVRKDYRKEVLESVNQVLSSIHQGWKSIDEEKLKNV